ncbi:MAG: cytochrome c [Epsilonproteobacteria bacterium]|nr:cytochrome c [Campylobacterota bacterium]
MKFTHLVLTTSLLFSLSQASQTAQELFDAKCLMCHKKTKPTDMSSVIAPAIMGVMRHMKMSYPKKVDAVNFISDYVLDPQKSKAICMPKKIKRFGLMPSQKGNVTKEEVKIIASWLFDNYPPKGFRGMGQGNMKQMNKNTKNTTKQVKQKKNSPFLITKSLPHMTKLIKMKWNDKTLSLTKEQKTKLLEVRKSTLNSIKDIKPKVTKLEKKIVMLTKMGEDNQKIFTLIDKLSKLKAKATKAHVECIINTKKILTPSQLYYLKKR